MCAQFNLTSAHTLRSVCPVDQCLVVLRAPVLTCAHPPPLCSTRGRTRGTQQEPDCPALLSGPPGRGQHQTCRAAAATWRSWACCLPRRSQLYLCEDSGLGRGTRRVTSWAVN